MRRLPNNLFTGVLAATIFLLLITVLASCTLSLWPAPRHVKGDLQVNGDIKFGKDETLYAVGSEQKLRILAANISKDGTIEPAIKAGMGITVTHIETGTYAIVFHKPFSRVPSASTTEIYATSSGQAGDTRDNAVIVNLSAVSMTVETGNSSGVREDRAFSLIVIGVQ